MTHASIEMTQQFVQALFEGAMYTFVFLWTPALAPQGEAIPHGFIFAMFMLSSMAGSAVAGHFFNLGWKPEAYMKWVFLAGGACMAVPVLFHAHMETDDKARTGREISGGGMVQCLAFCVFEACIGLFWPSMMRMRAAHLPDELRATLINCFRIPLNLFVCVVLYNVSKFPLSVMFALCSFFMLVNAYCCRAFAAIIAREERTSRVAAGVL
jgi:MFS transporter, MFS domain-containing protein family, molybdate-anion transporter